MPSSSASTVAGAAVDPDWVPSTMRPVRGVGVIPRAWSSHPSTRRGAPTVSTSPGATVALSMVVSAPAHALSALLPPPGVPVEQATTSANGAATPSTRRAGARGEGAGSTAPPSRARIGT